MRLHPVQLLRFQLMACHSWLPIRPSDRQLSRWPLSPPRGQLPNPNEEAARPGGAASDSLEGQIPILLFAVLHQAPAPVYENPSTIAHFRQELWR